MILGLLIAVVSLGSYLFATSFKWSEMLTMFVFAPMAMVGGVWREWQRKRVV
jgi:TRAP-type C4-dicarboxylate transport system permease small subunit